MPVRHQSLGKRIPGPCSPKDMRPTRGEAVTWIVLVGADALVIDPAELSPVRGSLWPKSPPRSLITHDAKGARHALRTRLTPGDVAFDTMLAAYLAPPDQRSHKLEDVLPPARRHHRGGSRGFRRSSSTWARLRDPAPPRCAQGAWPQRSTRSPTSCVGRWMSGDAPHDMEMLSRLLA